MDEPRRPIVGRPELLSKRWMHGKYVRLVSYINDNHWYYIPLEHHATPPKKGYVPWSSLSTLPKDGTKNF